MSFGCKDIKKSPNNKIFYSIFNFFQKKEEKNFSKKRKGVCTKQFRRGSTPTRQPTRKQKNGSKRLNTKILIINEHSKKIYCFIFPDIVTFPSITTLRFSYFSVFLFLFIFSFCFFSFYFFSF
jgi:hypothetical protein